MRGGVRREGEGRGVREWRRGEKVKGNGNELSGKGDGEMKKGRWGRLCLLEQLSQSYMYLLSLVPRPHPLTRRNGLVNQVDFLGLAHSFATM